jgi:hypothetical protein
MTACNDRSIISDGRRGPQVALAAALAVARQPSQRWYQWFQWFHGPKREEIPGLCAFGRWYHVLGSGGASGTNVEDKSRGGADGYRSASGRVTGMARSHLAL